MWKLWKPCFVAILAAVLIEHPVWSQQRSPAFDINLQYSPAEQKRSQSIDAPQDISRISDRYSEMALVVADDFDLLTRNVIRETIHAAGGRVYLVYPPNVVIGRIPQAVHDQLVGKHGIRIVTARPVKVDETNLTDSNSRQGVIFFNWVTSGQKALEDERISGSPLPPLKEFVGNAWETSGSLDLDSVIRPTTHTSYPNDSLDGYTKVDVFYPESNGGIDINEFTWTTSDHNQVANWTSDGFYFWLDIATARGISPALTYVLTFRPGSYPEQQQPYEPIRRDGLDDELWVIPILENYGYTQGDKFARLRAFQEDQRLLAGAKNSFSVWVVYNPPAMSAPTTHPDGWYAYAYLGEYVKMNFQNNGYQAGHYPRIFAHEMGHVFWACDEYSPQCAADCSNCYIAGPRPASMNWNCELCTPNGPTPCIMHILSDYNWQNDSTCTHTRRQVGWPN